jgi:hypothetical protein
MKVRFSKLYFCLAILLLLTEIFIALFVHDGIIRPIGGDFLVVVFLYCLLQSFCSIKVVPSALFVLLFAYFIEILQYYHFIELIGLQDIFLARMVIGTTFSWSDIYAYTGGILFVVFCEWMFRKQVKRSVETK